MTQTADTPGLAPVRHVLENGIVAIAQETSFSPAVTISVAVRAGSVCEPDTRVGLAAFLGRVLDRGTRQRSAAEIAEALDDHGVVLRVATNRHVQTVSCTCLTEDFGTMRLPSQLRPWRSKLFGLTILNQLKNLQLGYRLGSETLSRWKISGVRLFVSVQNLFTITKYTGLDPEMATSANAATSGDGDKAVGIDWGTYPSARTFTAGVNLNF